MTRGGRAGIHSLELIESAIARPYNGYYRSISKKCAALIESMAANHGFIDGNKRTTLILVNLILRRSGYGLAARSREQRNRDIEEIILASVRHTVSIDDLVRWFDARITPR
jgi:death-on-curing protein